MTKSSLEVWAGHYDNMRIIMACGGKDEFLSVTKIPKTNVYGVTANSSEISQANENPSVPLGRNIRSIDGEFTVWRKPSNAEVKKRKDLAKLAPKVLKLR